MLETHTSLGAMRVIITARQSLTPVHEAVLTRLVNILGEISKNPSNPKFNQYCFESVSALIRYVNQDDRSFDVPLDSYVKEHRPHCLRLKRHSLVQHRSFWLKMSPVCIEDAVHR